MQTPEEFALVIADECLEGHDYQFYYENAADLIRARDEAIRADERAKVLAGFTEVYALAWDGEPSMGGKPHRVSAGAELSEPDARRALATVGRRKPNARVERRLVSPWEPITQPKEQKAMNRRRDTITLYRAPDGWRWRYMAHNGRILADSGQGYSRRADAVRGACRVAGAADGRTGVVLSDLRRYGEAFIWRYVFDDVRVVIEGIEA